MQSKADQVRDALVRLGGIEDPPIEPIVPALSQYGYRNKVEYSFTQGPDGVALGFHRAGRWDQVLDIEECRLTTDVGNAIRLAVRAWAREEGLDAYDQNTHSGYLRHLVVREGRNTGQILVMLVTNKGEKFDPDYLIEALRRFPEVRVDPLGDQRRPVRDHEPAVAPALGRGVDRGGAPRPPLPRTAERVLPDEHRDGREALRARARRRRADRAGDRLRPLLRHRHDRRSPLAAQGAHRVGDRDLRGGGRLRDRERDAERRHEHRVLRRQRRPGAARSCASAPGEPDVVIVDPPRAGLAGKGLRRTGELQAPRIVYVSCNPTTLAGDLKVLREDYGYELLRCTPVDMFPHTPHIESVSLLERRADSALTVDDDAPATDAAPAVGTDGDSAVTPAETAGSPRADVALAGAGAQATITGSPGRGPDG